jgi:type IV pilus assembly protein PilA
MRRDDGFTLVELLVVVVVLGILAAIAIPTYLRQRENAYVASATGDIRQVRIVLDSVMIQTNSYASADGATQATPLLRAEGYEGKPTTVLAVQATAIDYCIEGYDSRVPDILLVARSSDAGIQRDPAGC